MKRVCLFLFLILLISCTNKKDKVHWSPKYNKTFTVGYRVNHKFSNVFQNNGQECIYFANILTGKKILVLTLQGQKVIEIPLVNILKSENDIEAISLKSIDTILILSKNTNHLYFINRSGEIWRFVDLNPSLQRMDPKNNYQLISSTYGDFFFNNEIFLRCYLVYNESNKLSQYEAYKSYLRKTMEGPFFVKFSNLYSNSVQCKFGLFGFFNRFVKKNEVVDDFPYYYHTDRNLFCFSSFNDSIYEVVTRTLTVKNVHQIKSDLTSITREHIPITEKNILNFSEVLKKIYYKQGYIDRFFYDKYNKVYFVFAYHSLKNPGSDDESVVNGKCSMITYDLNFEKLGETVIDAKEFTPGYCIITKEGVLIFHDNQENKEYDKTKIKFSLFTMDKF